MRTRIRQRVLSFFPLSLLLSGAVSVSPCVNQYFEVKEGETTNRLTCRGLTSQDTVDWFAKGTAVGSCPPLPAGSPHQTPAPQPLGLFGEVFRPSRTSNAGERSERGPCSSGFYSIGERRVPGVSDCRVGSGLYPSCQMDYVCEFSNGSH